MMRRTLMIIAWTTVLLGSIGILHIVHDLKWPESKDRYVEVERASAIRPMISGDSVLSLCARDVPEELVVYLRYCLIPVRVQLMPKYATGKTLLIASSSSIAMASDTLRAARHTSALLWHYEDAGTAFELLQF